MYGNIIDDAIVAFGIICATVGAAIFAVCFWLVPWLWELAKPWLHTVTA